jgi:hypothetical protein
LKKPPRSSMVKKLWNRSHREQKLHTKCTNTLHWKSNPIVALTRKLDLPCDPHILMLLGGCVRVWGITL